LVLLGRFQLGLEQGLSSRYTTFSGQGVAALYLGLCALAPAERRARWMRHALVAAVAVSLPFAVSSALESGLNTRWRRMHLGYYLRTWRQQPDELLGQVFPARKRLEPEKVRKGAAILERRRLNVFAEPELGLDGAQESQQPLAFDLVDINGRPPGAPIDAATAAAVEIHGWAADVRAGRPAAGVLLTLDGAPLPAVFGLPFHSVGDALGSRRFDDCGFYASLATARLARGHHRLELAIVNADRRHYFRPPAVDLELR
jgi:hypothetical protein